MKPTRAAILAYDLIMYFETGNRYRDKESTIQGWMDKDKLRDEKIENAQPLEGIYCLSCGQSMDCSSKDLRDEQGIERILFWYDCPRDVQNEDSFMTITKNGCRSLICVLNVTKIWIQPVVEIKKL